MDSQHDQNLASDAPSPPVKLYWGFPVAHPRPEDPETGRRGIAMIIALFMIAVMMLFMADMQVNTMVQARLVAGTRDNIKAEYMAKSGANLATFLLNVDLAIDLTMAELGGPNAKVSDGPGDIWAQLNDLPIGGETLDMMGSMQETFSLSKVADSKVIDTFKSFDGQFTLKIEDESSRLNVNYCGVRSTAKKQKCQEFLKALLSCPAEKEYLDSKKVNVADLVGGLEDWSDGDQKTSELSTKGNESDGYSDRRPKTQPKNAPFDTLEELRMVDGWTLDIHTIFSPYLTVYPIPLDIQGAAPFAINFNTASRELLTCLFPKANSDCAEKSAIYINNREDKGASQSMQAVQETLRNQFCAEGEAPKYFTYRSDVYRIKVKAEVNDQSKELEAVVARQLPDAQDIKNNSKAAYKYLYWKML